MTELDKTLNAMQINGLKIKPQTEATLNRPILFSMYTITYNVTRCEAGMMGLSFSY
jgi:hypothetical protein